MTKRGAVAAKTVVLKRRTFTREFKLQVIREVEAGRARRKSPANIKSATTPSRSGAASCTSIRSARLPAVATLTQMKRASMNWNAWWAGSPWRTTF